MSTRQVGLDCCNKSPLGSAMQFLEKGTLLIEPENSERGWKMTEQAICNFPPLGQLWYYFYTVIVLHTLAFICNSPWLKRGESTWSLNHQVAGDIISCFTMSFYHHELQMDNDMMCFLKPTSKSMPVLPLMPTLQTQVGASMVTRWMASPPLPQWIKFEFGGLLLK